MRLTVTDDDDVVGVSSIEIHRVSCFSGGDDRNVINTTTSPVFHPNPVTDNLIIKNITKGSNISIFDANGIQVNNFSYRENENQVTFDLARVHPGVYWVTVKDSNQNITFKFVKI